MLAQGENAVNPGNWRNPMLLALLITFARY
jgi:hypothetical protein